MLSKLFKHRLTEYTVYIVMALTIVTIGVGIVWTLEDPHMLQINNAKEKVPMEKGTTFTGIPIRPKVLQPGGIVIMSLDYCKLKDTHGTVIARLVGQKFVTDINWPNDSSKAGCINLPIQIPLPEDANDDTYYVEFEVLYHVNPLKDCTVILQSDVFKVAK